MARIRTIKPEFWTSEQVMECSTTARLMFIGLWNFADDKGRMTASPKKIKAQIFPSDDLSYDNISGMLSELSKNDLITLYEHDNVEYIQIDGWEKHQRIDKPQPSKLPDIHGEYDQIQRMFEDRSKNIQRRKGMEGKGKESLAAKGAMVVDRESRDAADGVAVRSIPHPHGVMDSVPFQQKPTVSGKL